MRRIEMRRKTKKGENMNRKIMILMVAVVATVLPAVAVADVMITGSIAVHGSQAPEMVYLSNGPNYATADSSGLFAFYNGTTSTGASSGAATIGTVDLEGMANANVSLLNVLDLNYSVGSTSGMLWVNVSGPGFPSGAFAELSSTPISALSSSASGSYSLNSVPTNNGPFTVSGSGTYYVSFFLPASTGYSTSSLEISVAFVPS